MIDKTNEITRLHQVRIDFSEQVPPVRVLSVSVASEVGGAERSIMEAFNAFPDRRVRMEFCAPTGSALVRAFANAQMPVHQVLLRRFHRSSPLLLAGQIYAVRNSALEVARLCRDREIDVLHANTNLAELVTWEAARITKLPHVWHCRDMRPMHGFARILASSVTRIVATSSAVKAFVLNEGVKPEKVVQIDNGIDLQRMPGPEQCSSVRQRVRTALGIEAHRPVVLCVGAYVPWKRHELFLATLSSLRTRMPGIVGLLVGSDLSSQNSAYETMLREMIHGLKFNPGELHVLHQRDDVPDLMCAADLLVSCSDNEPFGRVVAEAGAVGLPVVSTRTGGKIEIINDGVTGLLTPPGDEQMLAAACATLLNDPARRQAMGLAARERIQQLYDVRRTARELSDLFGSIAQQAAT